jgi:glutamyl-tRNA(Gln) amidotransferase subunit D
MTHNGYDGKSLEMLKRFNVKVGDLVYIETKQGNYSATILPRYEYSAPGRIVAKLENGYNIGVSIDKIKSIKRAGKNLNNSTAASDLGPFLKKNRTDTNTLEVVKNDTDQETTNLSNDYPLVSLISTGGTISSRIDYRTGGVRAALTAAELYSSVPELKKYAYIEPEVLFSEYSENLTPKHWATIAKTIGEKILTKKYKGIVVAHGTDTMHYTASALSFALQNLPIPVILVGAQRSSDRPSSDAALNLLGATIMAIKSEIAGVFVAMHNSISDDLVSIHLGTRVRKNHTSRRDAFKSIDIEPIAQVRGENVEVPEHNSEISLSKRSTKFDKMIVKPNFNRNVTLLKFYPGFDPRWIHHSFELGSKIIIMEGTGLGHVSRECIPAIKKAIDRQVLVFITSQCIWGKMNLNVYETGRDLLSVGVIPLQNMLSETAVVKAMWALGNFRNMDGIRKVMSHNIANEITNRIKVD